MATVYHFHIEIPADQTRRQQTGRSDYTVAIVRGDYQGAQARARREVRRRGGAHEGVSFLPCTRGDCTAPREIIAR